MVSFLSVLVACDNHNYGMVQAPMLWNKTRRGSENTTEKPQLIEENGNVMEKAWLWSKVNFSLNPNSFIEHKS